MATPLLLYLFNEASSGTTPTTVGDTSSGTALNLTITYGTGTWVSIGGGRGLNYVFTSGAVSATLSGNKVATALAGITGATLEFVADTTNYTGFNEFGGLNATGSQDVFTVLCGGAGNNQVGVAGAAGSAAWFDVTPGLHHFLAVQDNTQATAANRLKLYVDGVLATVNPSPFAPTYPTLNQSIDATFTNYANNNFCVGCLTSAGVQSFVGPIYFAALYASPLTSSDASAHSTALLSNNDADPNGATPVFSVDQDISSLRRLPARRQTDTSALALPRQLPPLPWVDRQFEYVRPSAMRGARLATSGLPVSAVIAPPALAGWNPDPSTLLPARVARPASQAASAVTFPASAVAQLTQWVPATAPLLPQVQPLRMPRNTGGVPQLVTTWIQDPPVQAAPRVIARAESSLPLTGQQAAVTLPWAADSVARNPPAPRPRAESATTVPPLAGPVALPWAPDAPVTSRAARPVRAQSADTVSPIAIALRGFLDFPLIRRVVAKFRPMSIGSDALPAPRRPTCCPAAHSVRPWMM
jgi:hypothetical protein